MGLNFRIIMLRQIEGEKEEFLPVGIQNPYWWGVASENGSKYVGLFFNKFVQAIQ